MLLDGNDLNGMTTERTAELSITGAQIAQPVVQLRLILRLFLQRVRDAMCQAAKLAKQQGKNEQQTDRQRRMHLDYCRAL